MILLQGGGGLRPRNAVNQVEHEIEFRDRRQGQLEQRGVRSRGQAWGNPFDGTVHWGVDKAQRVDYWVAEGMPVIVRRPPRTRPPLRPAQVFTHGWVACELLE